MCNCGDTGDSGKVYTPEGVDKMPNVGVVQAGGGASCDTQTPLSDLYANCKPTPAEMAWANRYQSGGGSKGTFDQRKKLAKNVEKMAVQLLTTKTEDGVRNFVSKNMSNNASKQLPKLLRFMHTIPNKKVEYGVFGLTPTSARLFVLAQGTMRKSFNKVGASNKRENLTCIADVNMSSKTGKIKDLKLKFEFLNKQEMEQLRRLQKNTVTLPEKAQSGGGYYLDLEHPIGKMPGYKSYLNCCPPVFPQTGNLTGGGVLQELAEPMTSVFAPGLYAVQGVREGINALKKATSSAKKGGKSSSSKKQKGGVVKKKKSKSTKKRVSSKKRTTTKKRASPKRKKSGSKKKQRGGVACGNVSLKNVGCTQPDWGKP